MRRNWLASAIAAAVKDREFVAVLGPSGCAGLLTTSSGGLASSITINSTRKCAGSSESVSVQAERCSGGNWRR